MPLLLGSLRGKFVLLMAMAYIVTIALTLLAFNSVSSSITRTLGVRPEQVRLLITEHSQEEFSVGGVTAGQRQELAAEQAAAKES